MIDDIRDFWSDGIVEKAIVAFFMLVAAMIPLAIYGSILEAREWEQFKVDHNCKVVAREKGHSSTGVGYGVTSSGHTGMMVTTNSTPDKTGWLCDDGVTYWR